jgi:glyoxylate/hydroxypyruvate reductase
MRIHVQNASGDRLAITPEQWEAACLRAGEPPHDVTFADDDAGFASGIAEAELLVTAVSDLAPRLPLAVPHPNLRMIFVTAAGVDRLAPFARLPAGVAVLNNRGAHAAKAGEFGVMALLMLVHRIPAYMTFQRAGAWRHTHASVALGRRVTIVGTGTLGAAVATQARRFGMIVTGVRTRAEPHPEFDRTMATDALDAALAETDILLLACPLTPATRGLIDRRRLGLLPRRAGVVNIGRGLLLDQDALCDLLDQGHLAGALLDVFASEPLPPDHRIWTTPNLIATPHISADDPSTYNPVSLDILLANLKACREGKRPPNLVDLGRGY